MPPPLVPHVLTDLTALEAPHPCARPARTQTVESAKIVLRALRAHSPTWTLFRAVLDTTLRPRPLHV